MIRAALLAVLMVAAPAAAEAPGLRAVIDCGSLSGQGAVEILAGGASIGVVRVICPAPRGA